MKHILGALLSFCICIPAWAADDGDKPQPRKAKPAPNAQKKLTGIYRIDNTKRIERMRARAEKRGVFKNPYKKRLYESIFRLLKKSRTFARFKKDGKLKVHRRTRRGRKKIRIWSWKSTEKNKIEITRTGRRKRKGKLRQKVIKCDVLVAGIQCYNKKGRPTLYFRKLR